MAEPDPSTLPKPMTKTDIFQTLADDTGLAKKQVSDLFEKLSALIGRNLREQGPGVFTVPGLMKIKVVRKPATPERTGINPFTKEETVFKAKPPRNVVKVQPLKSLKDMV